MRSKVSLISNILSSFYSVILLWIYGGIAISVIGATIAIDGALSKTNLKDLFSALLDQSLGLFKFIFDLLEISNPSVLFLLYGFIILLFVHCSAFIIGCAIGWVSYAKKNRKGAKIAAILYLVGTICYPFYLIYSLPITILGFVGSNHQQKINEENSNRK